MNDPAVMNLLIGAFGTVISGAIGMLVNKIGKLTESVVELDKTVAVVLSRLNRIEKEQEACEGPLQ